MRQERRREEPQEETILDRHTGGPVHPQRPASSAVGPASCMHSNAVSSADSKMHGGDEQFLGRITARLQQ